MTCTRRIAALVGCLEGGDGVVATHQPDGHDANVGTAVLDDRSLPQGTPDVDCAIAWHPPGSEPTRPGSEVTIQAMTGIAHLHGLERGQATPLRLEVASVVAGMLASQGLLAAMVANRRQGTIRSVDLSVTQAALLLISQYIARATAADSWGDWVLVGAGADPGPPFETADHHWVEVETLDTDAWSTFWQSLGVDRSVLGRGWTLFNARYSTACCTMPPGFHQAVRRRSLAEVSDLARACEISLSPVRTPGQVRSEPGDIGPNSFAVIDFEPTSEKACPDRPAPRAREKSPRNSTSATDADRMLPLGGIRVVEATSRIQGPLAGQLLRMLGADLVRVEPPGGDANRLASPSAGDTSALHLCINRGKRAVELDLARSSGRQELVELLAGADVFLHNWRPGKADEWNLGYQDLRDTNPALVYCSASGWGVMADRCPPIGMEYLVQAYTGMGHAIRAAGEPPAPSRLLLVDVMGALVTCEGILAGLYHRERVGRGGRVTSSLLAGAIALQAHVLDGDTPSPTEVGVLAGPLRACDRDIFVTVSDRRALTRLTACCGLPPSGNLDARLEASIRDRIALRPAQEWQEALWRAAIPCEMACTDLKALVHDPMISGCLEPIQGAWAPTSPWRFLSVCP
jgi:crotonobetainyl-CoA:carnitine CoA-transferase CaiB-like acyl-CoA transferase